jgi:hypothetical protein
MAAIMAGLWLVIGESRQAALLSQASSQHLALVDAVQNFYRNRASIPAGLRNAELVQAAIAPAEMQRAGTVDVLDHAWGPVRPNGAPLAAAALAVPLSPNLGTSGVAVYASNNVGNSCAASCYFFAVAYRGISQDNCLKFGLETTSKTAKSLSAFVVNGNAGLGLSPAVQALGLACANAAGSDMVFVHRLRPDTK